MIVKKKKKWVHILYGFLKNLFLSKSTTLKRRQEIEFVFKGGADSIYSNINPRIYVVNQDNRSSAR